MEDLLEIEGLSGGYYTENIIRDVSLKIQRGDFFGIIGPNGSGKTTLIRLLTKILLPKKGEVYFQGENICRIRPKEFCRQVASVAQEIPLSFPFTVMEFVLMGRIPHLGRLQFESKKDFLIGEQSLSLTNTFGLKEKKITEISAGERQRLLIARALAQEPVLLFLDEPTSHLDIGHQIQILDLLKYLNRKNNLTIIMILHDLNLASAYCNRILLLNNGRIFREGTPEDVLTYSNIEAVYKTVVLVNNNPVTKRPNVILVPSSKKYEN